MTVTDDDSASHGPNPFTDSDLKRLKERLTLKTPISIRQWNLGDLLARLEASERMEGYIFHDEDCILNRREAGEPTPDGGYRSKYAGKWYQSKPINEEPKCDCGLDGLFEVWRKAKGE